MSTLTPGHPRASSIIATLVNLTTHSTWGVLLVSTESSHDQSGAIFSNLGYNVVVMNVSAALLASLPLSITRTLSRQLRRRAMLRGHSGDSLLTEDGRLHVSVKMAPYLIAVRCGARAIFDTIDDDIPLFAPPLMHVTPVHVGGRFEPRKRHYAALPPVVDAPSVSEMPTWPVLVTPRADVAPVVNPYSSLGGRGLFPRGFPANLEYNASFQVLHVHRQIETMRPLVQQWVSHGYPDLSATDTAALRSHVLPRALIKNSPPVILAPWAWTPWNTRGTLFMPDAYWALFLPPDQPSHLSDVLRSYWATRLLWDAGAHVSYRSVASPPANPAVCNVDFGFHNERLNGDCEGAFVLRDLLRPSSRTRLLAEELEFQATAEAMIAFLDAWTFRPAPAERADTRPELFRRAQTLMCNLAEAGRFMAHCRDCLALSGWLADLTSAGYSPPMMQSLSPPRADFHLRRPDPRLLAFTGQRANASYTHAAFETIARGGAKAGVKIAPPLPLGVCLTGLADRVHVRLEEEDIQTAEHKRAKVSDELMLAHNLRALGAAFGPTPVHAYYVMGSYNVPEGNLHLILSGRLPFIAVVIHRDWNIEPLRDPNEQLGLPRHDGSFVTLKWTNEARHYQRSQLHQLWEVAKCFEVMAGYMSHARIYYGAYLRHRADYSVTYVDASKAAVALKRLMATPRWADTVYVPQGEDWRVRRGWQSRLPGLLISYLSMSPTSTGLASASQGINDRVALGGWRAMSTYFLRFYGLHAALWESGREDYNHVWAEPFLNTTIREANMTLVREPALFNYSEFDEVPRKTQYLGDDVT